MIIATPIAANYDHHRDASLLYFEHREGPLPFYMRGSVCWPVLYKDSYVGCAYVAGYNLLDNSIYIFEELIFSSIDHVIDPNDNLYRPGLVHLLNRAWSLYYCNTFFVSAIDPQHLRYHRQIQGNVLVTPKPGFIKLKRFKDPTCAAIADEAVQKGTIQADARFQLRAQYEEYSGQPDMKDPGPAVRAFWYLIAGFVWLPYIHRKGRAFTDLSLPTPLQAQLQTPRIVTGA